MHPGVRRAREMLRVLGPVAAGNVVEPQRRPRLLGLDNERLCLLPLLPLYGFGFAPSRLLRRSEKAVTLDLKVVAVERGAWIASDGHGESFRVWLVMNSLRSVSVNILRARRLPWPMATYLSAPEATWPLSVLIEQFSLAAACAAVLSPSGEDSRGLRGATCPTLAGFSSDGSWLLLGRPTCTKTKRPSKSRAGLRKSCHLCMRVWVIRRS